MTISMIIDSYMHCGVPRFLDARRTIEAMERDGSQRGVLVSGPGHPDIASLIEAHRLGGERVRTIGVPYGSTPDERAECVRACLDAGAIGIRMQQDEAVDTPDGLTAIGERAGWIYATDPLKSPRHARCLLDWLERYPQGRIAAPHFLKPHTHLLDQDGADELLAHERFFPILSRHGGVSRESDPHEDLRPWVERVIATCGWQRLLWGGELPVLYWREETIPQARSWIERLGVGASEADLQAFFHDNANRLFFQDPAPPCTITHADIPAWIRSFNPWPVKVLHGTLPLEAPVYHRLLCAYHDHLQSQPDDQPPLSAFIAQVLERSLPS